MSVVQRAVIGRPIQKLPLSAQSPTLNQPPGQTQANCHPYPTTGGRLLRRVKEDRPLVPWERQCTLQLVHVVHDPESALRVIRIRKRHSRLHRSLRSTGLSERTVLSLCDLGANIHHVQRLICSNGPREVNSDLRRLNLSVPCAKERRSHSRRMFECKLTLEIFLLGI